MIETNFALSAFPKIKKQYEHNSSKNKNLSPGIEKIGRRKNQPLPYIRNHGDKEELEPLISSTEKRTWGDALS